MKNNIIILDDCNLMEDMKNFVAVKYKGSTLKILN